ncbi:Large extracellular alpha-helical protein [Paramagnetospirillum magnetotacticum MS-1]|uniref:Large extracellular alpha-helical protein n=1 Tax=Paramagnetospirillum magnetotacticum MS-1 TaxID=272627 RepID=A0A0C2YZ24_PARME|nr:MG2 domain-containing protein [Paramagnetospirillum magnetotacticum]KIM00344.1 Large extracellular alpha-helical protein [Paramagnetospirillum magnetotacticum MS-1]
MTNLRRRLFAALALLVALLAAPGWAADQLRRPGGAQVVPEHFLRSWDPVTVFFDADTGPAKGGAEDHPERVVTLDPPHPGAFTWMDSRTLQFRPTVAWPPMGRFAWTVQGRRTDLVTLMSGAVASIPAEGAGGLDPIEAITLSFREPIAPDILARLATIEIRPLPGVGGDRARTLDAADFDVKVQERLRSADPAVYVLNLHHPIGPGNRVVVHLRLAPDQVAGHEEQRIAFSTAQPFHVTRFGCRDSGYPSLPEGVSYAKERALQCPADERSVHLTFSGNLKPVGPVEGRNLVRLSPQVDGLRFETVNDTLVIRGRFEADTLYQVRLEPSALSDAKGRLLHLAAANQLYLSFPAKPGFIKFMAGEGIAERFGPQMVPMKSRGVEHMDLRIHPIDPLDRSLWPFPRENMLIDETRRPPAPGEEPKPWTASYAVSDDIIAEHIRAFGSPSISELVQVPGGKGNATTSFGLNLRPHLARIAGADKPGHYLVGIRRLESKSSRYWMRLQVTDLSLTAVDEVDRVRFAVTSLASGQPVAGASIRLEGRGNQNNNSLPVQLTTGADGTVSWEAPGNVDDMIRRIVVAKDGDILVLDPARPPRFYAEGGWRDSAYYENWLNWTTRALADRKELPRDLCHIFTERPIYRPDEPVHIKGYVRKGQDGKLDLSAKPGTLVVRAPDGTEWRYPLAINEFGSFYHKFDAKTAATGIYKVSLDYKTTPAPRDESEDEDLAAESGGGICHVAKFKKEAYRLPRFEVQLHAPLSVGLDAAFPVGLTSEYYAGGVVADRPLRWRVTQVPFAWTPKARPGFLFSADQRFSGNQPFRSSPVLERDGKTDPQGAARLVLDPTIEATAQPRKYIVEATVVGDDDQSVTNTQEVLALPPFVLGLKLPRFIEKTDRLEPLVVVEDGQGKPIAGQKVTVRLLKRQWNSILQATDFTQGSAKYVTETVEEKVAETTVNSAAEPFKVPFPINGAGVYVVEVESQDRLGRLQSVKVDLFAGGERPATWSRPPAEVFSVAPDKTAYAPGETAKLVLQSPFQNGQALAVIEEPDGHNRYEWVTVKNGYGTLALAIKPEYMPRLPVHFVLMRGRLKGDDDQVGIHADLRKPATVAATQWVTVTPAKNLVKVEISAPRKAQPGQDVDLTVKLADDLGQPLAGEVTLWMVDQAVLALAKEARLDPLPQFIVPRDSKTKLRDTRNSVFGLLPLQEEPGGDEGDDGSPLLRATVRKNFTPVPYYEPSLKVGPSGTVTVTVRLPDSLTNFKLRAKAVSGPSRFGYGTGDMQVRLPVLVQPALPRFVRPGDSFQLSAIGRVVDGSGGPGRAKVKLSGLDLAGSDERGFEWQANVSQRLDFPVKVPVGASGNVDVTMGVDRATDGAKDAFQVSLPVLPDREKVAERTITRLSAEAPVVVPAVTEAVRPGTLERDVVVAGKELVALAGGLDSLLLYPFGCTEQRISLARAGIGTRQFGGALLGPDGSEERIKASMRATQEWIAQSVADNGLVSYWPGGRGYVAVTAWAVQFMTEAKAAGLAVDQSLLDKLSVALKQSLRSDYRDFVDGQSWSERSWALAALTGAGQGDATYAAELARKAPNLRAEALAQVAWALAKSPATPVSILGEMQKRLWSNVVVKLDKGRDVYGGLQEDGGLSPLILPSETRTLAQILRASMAVQPTEPRNRMLADALLALGKGDGWGSTNANAEALLALADWIKAGGTKAGESAATIAFGAERRQLTLSDTVPAVRQSIQASEATISLGAPSPEPLAVWVRTSYLPEADGSAQASAARGFAVDRDVWIVAGDGGLTRRIALDTHSTTIALAVGEVIEDHVTVVNSADRAHIAVVVPLAAGMEPLNPALATAPPEAKPSEAVTRAPSYAAFLDDKVSYFYDELPKGTYHFRLRSRATVPGRFIQPAAAARAMYDDTVNGNGNGALVVIARP